MKNLEVTINLPNLKLNILKKGNKFPQPRENDI